MEFVDWFQVLARVVTHSISKPGSKHGLDALCVVEARDAWRDNALGRPCGPLGALGIGHDGAVGLEAEQALVGKVNVALQLVVDNALWRAQVGRLCF